MNKRCKMTRWQTCSQVPFFAASATAWYTVAHLALQSLTQVVWKCWCCKVSNLWLIITSLGYLVLMNRRTKVTRWQTSSQVFFSAASAACVVAHVVLQDSRTVKVQAWKYWCCKLSDWWEWPMVILCDKVTDLSAGSLLCVVCLKAITLAGLKGWHCVDLMGECILIIWLAWFTMSEVWKNWINK